MYRRAMVLVWLGTWALVAGCGGENGRPAAAAGQDRRVSVGATVQLDASGSSDPDGDALTYLWILTRRPAESSATLAAPFAAQTSFLVDLPGEYEVSLVVSDGAQMSEPDVVVIHTDEGTAPDARLTVSNAHPYARETVQFDGRTSTTAGGGALAYDFRLLEAPEGSIAALEPVDAGRVALTLDLAGRYEVQLLVWNELGSDTANQVLYAAVPQNAAPTADAGADFTAARDAAVVLDGTGSSDPDGDALAFTWTLLRAPTGSKASLAEGPVGTATFFPDLEGEYEAELVVSDGLEESAPDRVVVYVSSGRIAEPLPYRVIDAEYSDALDALVMVSAGPNQLHVYDTASGTTASVDLPLPPSSVSVDPAGTHAAVGHDGWVSYVELETPALVDSYSINVDALDVILTDAGFVYVMPRRDQWAAITALELSTGEITSTGDWAIYAGTLAKLHPDGTKMYGADNGISPSDIERYDIDGPTVTVAYDSPYHGDYSMCGNLWISQDGRRIFTACGNTFRSSDVRAEDMTYAGKLEGMGGIIELDQSTAADQVAAIPYSGYWGESGDDRFVKLFGNTYLAFQRSVLLPPVDVAGSLFASHGRFVFFSSDGTKLWAVVQAEEGSGLLDDQAVVEIGLE